MIELLCRPLRDEHAIYSARDRVQAVVTEAGASAFEAALCSCVFSEVVRGLCSAGHGVELTLQYVPRDGVTVIVDARGEGIPETVLAPIVPPWERDRNGDDLRLTWRQRSASRSAARPVDPAKLASIAQLLTREELLADLRRHSDELEVLVDERTVELRDALTDAQAAAVAKGQFLSHMSHELRTPLHGMLGYVQIMQGLPSATSEQSKLLDSVHDCGQHLLELINGVLDLAKLDADRVDLQVVHCDPAKVIDEVANVVRGSVHARDLRVSTHVDSNVPQTVSLDRVRLRQCLVNLLGNSAKFTDDGEIGIRLTAEGQRLVFCVWDTGIGMTPEEAAGVLEPFTQGRGGRERGGSGLGLAITHSLTRMLGGELRLESERGQGTRFFIDLPCVVDERVPAVQPIEPAVQSPPCPAVRPSHPRITDGDVAALGQLDSQVATRVREIVNRATETGDLSAVEKHARELLEGVPEVAALGALLRDACDELDFDSLDRIRARLEEAPD